MATVIITIQTAIAEAVPFIVLLIGLALTVLTDTYISRFHKKILIIVIFLTFTLIFQNIADCLLDKTPYIFTRKILSIYGYSVRPAIIVLFYYFVSNSKRIILAWGLVFMNAMLYMTALFSPITFTYGEPYYVFVRGPLGYTAHIVSAVLLIGLFLLVIYEYRKDKKEMIFPITCFVFITFGIFIDSFSSMQEISALSALTLAIIIACVFVYFWFHIQFVRLYESDLRAEQRIKIMISQIQPHFLYNTIATFRALCKKDADKASLVAENFAQYLRQNLDLLESKNLIPIEKEIEHTKTYTDIEKVRFDNIHIDYVIEDTSFYVPPLSVQPMVENAIRHGVRTREKGIVSIATRRIENMHEIVISDNGTGFDQSNLNHSDEKHIGIKNVKERIEKLCKGTLEIQSEPGVGTTVIIRIPETGEKQ